MRTVWPWLSIGLLVGSAAGEEPPTVEQWRAAELRFEAAKTYAHPFREVDLTVTFAGPRGLSLTRPAFWDGGNVWKVRFAPVETGEWTWTTTAGDPSDTGLHGRTGRLRCVPYTGPLDIYRHGFLRVSPDRRHLVHQDGTPFFWLADIHWLWESERLDECNAFGWASQFKGMADERARQGYNVYQVELFGRWQQSGAGGTAATPEAEPQLAHFQRNVDPKWQYLADQGYVVAATLGILDKAVTAERGVAEARMARYVCARYGAYPACWLMYQECTGNVGGFRDSEQKQVYLDVVRRVGTTFMLADAYHHPRTAHSDASLVTAFRGEPWLDLTMFQGGHGRTIDRTGYLDHYFDATALPQIEGEADFEHLFEGSTHAGARVVTTDDMREKAWQAMQCGCCGYSYAANGVWQATWAGERKGNSATYGNTPWSVGLKLPGGAQMAHLKAFYTALPWWTLQPRPECDGWLTGAEQVPTSQRPALSVDPAANTVVVYLYRGQRFAAALHHLRNTTYQARWFDPRCGEYTPLPDALPVDGTWTCPAQPNEQDWVLLLTARESATTPVQPAESKWPAVLSARLAERARNLSPKAKVTASSTDLANQVYSPEHAIDGRTDTSSWHHWSNAGSDPPSPEHPVWLRLDWPAPVTVRKVVLYTMLGYEVQDYAFEYFDGQAWLPLPGGRVEHNTADRRELLLAQPLTMRALRFLGYRGPRRQPTVVRVVEVEVIAAES